MKLRIQKALRGKMEAVAATDSGDEGFHSMKVTELRKELKARGLPATGTKMELLERLQNAMSAAKENEAEESMIAEEADNSFDNELSQLSETIGEHAVSEEVDAVKSAPSAEVKPLKKRAIVETSNGAVSTEKVLLNRTAAVANAATEASAPQTAKVPAVSTDAKKTALANKSITAVKTMTAQERLAMRAQRFNISSSEAKKLKLANSSAGATTLTGTVKTTGDLVKVPDIDVLKKRAERFGENVSSVMKQIEEKEKVLKRKLRFGAAASSLSTADEQEKKKLRAQRFGLT